MASAFLCLSLGIAACDGSQASSQRTDASAANASPSPLAASDGQRAARVVGLTFPRGGVASTDGASVGTALRSLAQRRFVGSADTIQAQVFPLQRDSISRETTVRYFVVLLPFGDREVSRWNDSTSLYLAMTTESSTELSQKLVIVHAPSGGIGVRDLSDVDGDGSLEVILCEYWFEGDSTIVLERRGAGLRTRARPESVPRGCPDRR